MGIISTLAGLGGLMRDAGQLTTVVRGNKGEEAKAEHLEHMAALSQLGSEFAIERTSWFDILIDGLNRLPRPALAMGTLGLFIYAMADPIGFASRMQGLELVPDPLWWLLGAIVSFYFGARELHYFRDRRPKVSLDNLMDVTRRRDIIEGMRPIEPGAPESVDPPRVERSAVRDQGVDGNAALEAWRAQG